MRSLFAAALVATAFLAAAKTPEDASLRTKEGTESQFTISGTITCAGSEVNDVNLIGLGVVTDSNGFYTASVDLGFSGTVTPAKYGYTFDPNSRVYSSVFADLTAEDYNALPADNFDDNRRGSMWRRSP